MKIRLHHYLCLSALSALPAFSAEVALREWFKVTRPDASSCAGQVVARNTEQIFLQLSESGACGANGELVWVDRGKVTNLEKRTDTVAGKRRSLWSGQASGDAIGANSPSPSTPSGVANTVGLTSSGMKTGFRMRIFAEGNAKGCMATLKALDKDSLLVSYTGGQNCPKKNTIGFLNTSSVTRFQAKGSSALRGLGTAALVVGTLMLSAGAATALVFSLEGGGYWLLPVYFGVLLTPPIAVGIARGRHRQADMDLGPGTLFAPPLQP